MVQSLDEARRRSQSANRVPPHNLAAEQSLLGAMLLSRDAIAAAVETCASDDFYKPAHGHVFDAITTLYSQGEPADPLTVSDVLQRAGLLDAVGGLPALTALQTDTPATANAGRYARIVEEHALLRRLIRVAGEIAELGYGVPDDVTATVDRAEALVFDIAERRVTDTMRPLRELLEESLDRLSALYSRQESITGVPTGFRDLDEQLSGLQPSALLIVGARPAMGKALALDTPVPTPRGWAVMGELEVGDQVLDEAGRPCRVTYLSPVRYDRPCYRVELDDGCSLVADADHQWLACELQDSPGPGLSGERRGQGMASGDDQLGAWWKTPRVVTTAQMLSAGIWSDGLPRWRIPLAEPLHLPWRTLPEQPYELGSRIGAGWCEEIPSSYSRASLAQRRELLRGVVDSAACAGSPALRGSSSCVEVSLRSRAVALQVRELVCSLGFSPGPLTTLVGSAAGARRAVWRVSWDPSLMGGGDGPATSDHRQPSEAAPGEVLAGDTGLDHGSLGRRDDGRKAVAGRAVVAVAPVDPVAVRCITVDSPNHLYLVGESMVPTHNTAFALGVAAHAAMVARVPTLIFSLEMSHSEITQRLLVSEARVPGSRIRNGQLHESDWPKISNAIGRLGDAPLFIDDNPNVTVMELRAKARRMKSKDSGLGLIIVDYLQLMTGRSSAENRQVEVSEISRGLKILARELQVPVVALSQLSRTLESRADKRPMLADLRESGSLEQDADVVMFLYRDEMYNPDSSDRGSAEVILAKHRNGPTGKVNLAFLDHYTRFADMARV